MHSFIRLAVVALFASSLFACSSARVVHDTRTGGTVALRGPEDGAREKAAVLMRTKCPQGYSIVEQGEVPYGQTATTTQWGRGVQTTQVDNKHEWQIVFACAGVKEAGTTPFIVRF